MIAKTTSTILIASIAFLTNTADASEKIGVGKINDGRQVAIYSDGTWKIESAKKTKDKPLTYTYSSIKHKVETLCTDDHEMRDMVMGSINTWQSIAKTKGIPKEQFWSCLSKATGCLELASLTTQCSEQ